MRKKKRTVTESVRRFTTAVRRDTTCTQSYFVRAIRCLLCTACFRWYSGVVNNYRYVKREFVLAIRGKRIFVFFLVNRSLDCRPGLDVELRMFVKVGRVANFSCMSIDPI